MHAESYTDWFLLEVSLLKAVASYSYSLNSLKGDYIGDYIGDYYRAYKGGYILGV